MLPLPDRETILFNQIEQTGAFSTMNASFNDLTDSQHVSDNTKIKQLNNQIASGTDKNNEDTDKTKPKSKRKKQVSDKPKKARFEQWEDLLIVKERTKYGNHWSKIAQKLPGRGATEIKNRWYSVLRSRFPTSTMFDLEEHSETDLNGLTSD